MKNIPYSEWALLAFPFLAIFCLWPDYSLNYSVGYHQESILPLVYKSLFALLAYFFIFPCLLIIWIMGLVRSRHRRWRTILLGFLLIMFVAHYFLPNAHDRILLGFKDGMLHSYTPEEIRSFARDFDKLPGIPQSDMNGRAKLYWNDKYNDNISKTGLEAKYKFLANCLDVVAESTNTVDVEFGGFDNHWGFSVSTDGTKVESWRLHSTGKIIRASDDIYFWSEF